MAWLNQSKYQYLVLTYQDSISLEKTKITTQAHAEPGKALHWALVGDIEVNTEWNVYTYEGTITSQQDGCKTIVLDLNQDKNGGIDFCFDDISVKINEEAEPVDEGNTAYITNGDFEGSDFSSFVYTADRM